MPVIINRGIYYSPAEAAERIGLTVGRIRQQIRSGEIVAREISPRSWIISEAEVKKAAKQRKKA